MIPDGSLIEARGLALHDASGVPLFTQLDFTLRPGEILGLLGRNGSGKTTLLRMLLGRLKPDHGQLKVFKPLGYMPQISQLAFDFTVEEVVGMGRIGKQKWSGHFRRHDSRLIQQAMERLQITHLARRPIKRLSGGERQMVLLARALASEAKLLLMDEPMSALDLDNQRLLLAVLSKLAQEDKLGILFSTHNPDHLFAVADTALVLRKRQAAQTGEVKTLLTEAVLSDIYGLPITVQEFMSQGQTTRHAVARLYAH